MTYDHWKATNPADEMLDAAPQRRRRRTTYDSRCEDLAEVFLEDIPTKSKEDIEELAMDIQQAIEDFIQDRWPERYE